MDTLQQTLANTQATLTAAPGADIAPAMPAQDAWSLVEEKRKREKAMAAESSMTFDGGVHMGSYLGAMWRQDSPVDGTVASIVGNQMAPVPGYVAAADKQSWDGLTAGIGPEFHSEFNNATSPAHADFIRQRILQKQNDLNNLGDLGAIGTTGRLLFGLVEPSSALTMVLSGGVAGAVKGSVIASRALNTARAAGDIVGMETATKALAVATAREGTAAAYASGIGAGAGFNAGFEKLRQSVNFEHDNGAVLEAGLVGTMLAAPFVHLNAREMTKLSETARLEHTVLSAIRKEREGGVLTGADAQAIKEHATVNAHVQDIETGRVDAADHPMAGGEKFKPMPAAEREAALAGEEPEGFQGGSIGSGQVAPLGIDPTYPHIGTDAKGDPVYTAVGRMDIYATLNKQPNLVLQELGHAFVKDAIGNSKFYAQGRTASESKSLIKRAIGGEFHKAGVAAWDEAVKIRNLGVVEQWKQHRDFFENVSRVARGDHQVLIDNPDIAQQLNKAAMAQTKVYDELARRAQKAGVEGADGLVPGGDYVNRIWNHDNIRKAVVKLDEVYGKGAGRGELNRILAAASPVMRNDVEKAGKFLDAVKKLEFSHVMQDIQLQGKDMMALRAELSKHLSPGEIDAVVDVMFAAKKTEADAGRAANLKYRLDIDESYRESLKNGQEFRISDLFENDSRILVDKYINSMGGHIAMAEKGYRSRAEFMAKMKEAEDYHMANHADTTDSAQYNGSKQLVLDMYDHITGRPMSMQTFNKADRFLGAFRAYARSAFLGQLGVAAGFEMKNAIALGTTRAFWQQMPAFREFLTALRTGRLANKELAQDIEAMSGFGLEKVAGHARQHEVTDFTYDRGLTRFEGASNNASHAVDIISGNAHLTSATRQFSASIMVQKHYNMATGQMKITPKIRERMVHQGIDSDNLDAVLAHLKEYTVADPKGNVKEIRYEDWQAAHPDTYDNYVLAMEREVRDAIQDHDIGETMPWQHGTIGKVFGELRTFNMAAHSKQFLKGAHYHDRTMMTAWTMSFMGEAMAYSLQQSLNFAHNPVELEKRLSLERIASATVQRMAVLGIMPMLMETSYATATGGSSLFQGGGTTNTDNRNLFKTPSGMLANKLYKGLGTVSGAVNPFTPNIVTKNDMRDLMSVVPGGNTWLMRNINDAVSSTFPKSEAPKHK